MNIETLIISDMSGHYAVLSEDGDITDLNFTEQKLEHELEKNKHLIASTLAKGRDVELRKTTGDTLKVIEVLKRIKN